MITLFRKPTKSGLPCGFEMTRHVSKQGELLRHESAKPVSAVTDFLRGGSGPVEDALREEVFNPCGISDGLVVGRSEYLVLLIE